MLFHLEFLAPAHWDSCLTCSACRLCFEFLASVHWPSFLVQRLYMLTWNSKDLRIGLLLQAASTCA